jgi:hypothetical protein
MTSQNHNESRKRIAHLLGETPPEEQAAAEAISKADPNETEALKTVIGAVEGWAKKDEPHYAALDPAAISGRTGERSDARSLFNRLRPFAWPLAFAVMAIAISQSSFNIQLGGMSVAWGVETTGSSTESLASLQSTLNSIQEKTAALETQVTTVTQTTVQLGEAATELAQNQQAESLARYRDTQSLLSMARGGYVQQSVYR